MILTLFAKDHQLFLQSLKIAQNVFPKRDYVPHPSKLSHCV